MTKRDFYETALSPFYGEWTTSAGKKLNIQKDSLSFDGEKVELFSIDILNKEAFEKRFGYISDELSLFSSNEKICVTILKGENFYLSLAVNKDGKIVVISFDKNITEVFEATSEKINPIKADFIEASLKGFQGSSRLKQESDLTDEKFKWDIDKIKIVGSNIEIEGISLSPETVKVLNYEEVKATFNEKALSALCDENGSIEYIRYENYISLENKKSMDIYLVIDSKGKLYFLSFDYTKSASGWYLVK